jgi:hypothetical protein
LRAIIERLESQLKETQKSHEDFTKSLEMKEQEYLDTMAKYQMDRKSILQMNSFSETSLDTHKRLSEHWRTTIAQERNNHRADRNRHEQERTALLSQIAQVFFSQF